MADDNGKERGTTASRRFGIKATLVSWLEVGIAAQVALVLMAFFLSAKSQTVAVVSTAIACGLSVATLGIVVVSVVTSMRGGDRRDEHIGFMESVIESAIAVTIAVACMVSFFPRFGQFSETNMYSNKDRLQCVAVFVVGKDFVVPGSIQTDGFVVKAPEGEEVKPPTVIPKPGLTFVGWRYSGVGDPDIAAGTPIYLDANGTKNNSVVLYAEFVDATGAAYCACGNMEEGIFDGASWQGMNNRNFLIAFVPVVLASLAGLACLIRIVRRDRGGDGDKGDGGDKAGIPLTNDGAGEANGAEPAERDADDEPDEREPARRRDSPSGDAEGDGEDPVEDEEFGDAQAPA